MPFKCVLICLRKGEKRQFFKRELRFFEKFRDANILVTPSLNNLICVFYSYPFKLDLNLPWMCWTVAELTLSHCVVAWFITILFKPNLHWNSAPLCKLVSGQSTWILDPNCLGLNHEFYTTWLSDLGQVLLSLSNFIICNIGIIVVPTS